MGNVPIAIVAALDDEIRIIKSKMQVDSSVHVRPSLFTEGSYLRQKILLVRTGIGRAAAEGAMCYLFAHYKPSFCLHIGYCGGANPKDQPGDLLIASKISDAKNGSSINLNMELATSALSLCKKNNLRAHLAGLVTVDEIIYSPHEKAFIGTEHEADGIDMESSIFAGACAENKISSLVVRAVFDPLDIALPDMSDSLDSAGNPDAAGMFNHLVRRPKDMLKLPRLQYFAASARQALTKFVDAWLSREVL